MMRPTPQPSQIAAFRALASVEAVAFWLGTTQARLAFLLYSPRRPAYRRFTIPKRSGDQRHIAAPPSEIKAFQRQLLWYMSALFSPKRSVHGFADGRSVRSNADKHVGASIVLNFDLADFFGSFHFGRVRGVFANWPYSFSPAVAAVLAQICCFEGHLPQGAATSPILTNLICRRLDSEFARVARRSGCRYSRYADDLTLSTRDSDFPIGILDPSGIGGRASVGPVLLRIVERHDLRVNPTKTRVQRQTQRQTVTGVVVNQKLNLPRSFVRNIRGMIGRCEHDGLATADAAYRETLDVKRGMRTSPSLLSHIRGRIAYLSMVRGAGDPMATTYALRASRLDPRASGAVTIEGAASADVDMLENAFWVILGRDVSGDVVAVGTAFSLKGFGIVTAAHVFENVALPVTSWSLHSRLRSGPDSPITAYRKYPDLDLAIVETSARSLGSLSRRDSTLDVLAPVRVCGYPNWQNGNRITVVPGVVHTLKRVDFSGACVLALRSGASRSCFSHRCSDAREATIQRRARRRRSLAAVGRHPRRLGVLVRLRQYPLLPPRLCRGRH